MKQTSKIFSFITMFIVMCVMISSVGFVNGVVDKGQILTVSIVNQDPDPAEPGQYVDVRLKAENSGDEVIENVIVEVLPDFPFSIDSGDEPIKTIDSLNPFQKELAGKIIKYKIRIDDSAIQGVNYLKVRYKHGDGTWVNEKYEIDVKRNDASVTIADVSATPEIFSPGDDGTVKIKIKNTADSRMKNVNLKLDLALSSVGSTENLNALPFAPINSVTEKRVSSLSSNEEIIFTYNLKTYPNAEPGIYKIPVILTYEDEIQNEYTKEDFIGIVVGSNPNVLITIDEKKFVGDKGTISFKIVNRGLDKVKFSTFYLDESSGYKLSSSKENYIGNIDSDDYETIDYEITLTSGVTEVNLPVRITYSDSNNIIYEDTQNINVKVNVEKETGKSSGPNYLAIILGIVVIVLVILYWRKGSSSKK